ncbi:hypothetical protein SAMN05216267_10195 [Actinacidiphila rubida]|uniref:Secreted protein n=1 Tax=Actinacidiphila rubida TaxID=310780 RepID=A0A1H8MIQ2_9ACTN|nr:L,D-transpeptidase [Actinacidiphila rubida]SEO17275.1 hypothetical protein SAMN05216267_10195 [Actinacidiphila rubida]
MARFTPGFVVAGVAATALAVITGLTAVAAESAPANPYLAGRRAAGSGVTACGHAGVPADCGSGMRVVYSIAGERVWLVSGAERVVRSYPVRSGDPAPPLGTHQVFARAAHGMGGDGAPVEHVVFFAQSGDTNIGFSAAVGAAKGKAAAQPGSAIRESRDDGTALWQFATIGTAVEVVS